MEDTNTESDIARRGVLKGIGGGVGVFGLINRGWTGFVRGQDHVDIPAGEVRSQSYSHELQGTFVNRGTFEVYE